MANKINITDNNIYEWLCSTGYLLPRNERELSRYEKLHLLEFLPIGEAAIDPFAIISGSRVRKKLSFEQQVLPSEEQAELRMAARQHAGLPNEILDQILKNQKKNQDESDHQSESKEGDR